MNDEAPHLTPESLETYFRLGVSSVFQLSAEYEARLEVDPASDQLRLFVPAKGGLPDVTNLERIQVDRIEGAGATSRYRLIFHANSMHYAAYQLIESIVGYLREGISFGNAVNESLKDMKDLLASRSRLSEEQETGLWGELFLLDHLVEKHGEVLGMETWLGPTSAEHDFSFVEYEAEVKTTRSEARRHFVSSDTQLQPTPNRPLYLLSIQVTSAGPASGGRTLPQLVAAVRARLDRTANRFDTSLGKSHYFNSDADLYRTEFQLRSSPRGYLVDEDFPAITRQRLELAIPSVSMISDVGYLIDVGGLSHVPLPAPLDQFCEVPL